MVSTGIWRQVQDNEIREEGKNNKNMTGSETNKEYEHLNSVQMDLKGTHIPIFKKQDKFCGTEIEISGERQELNPQDYQTLDK